MFPLDEHTPLMSCHVVLIRRRLGWERGADCRRDGWSKFRGGILRREQHQFVSLRQSRCQASDCKQVVFGLLPEMNTTHARTCIQVNLPFLLSTLLFLFVFLQLDMHTLFNVTA